MKKFLLKILATMILAAALAGCGEEEAAPGLETEPPMQSESVQEVKDELTEFESDFGYTIFYDEDSFDYRSTEGYDEFILKSDEPEKPYVFVGIAYVEAEDVEQMKSISLGENPEVCTIGQEQREGQCSETEEDWDGGKIIQKTYVCPLDSGDALLIETQWYTEQDVDSYEERLLEMINSIQGIA